MLPLLAALLIVASVPTSEVLREPSAPVIQWASNWSTDSRLSAFPQKSSVPQVLIIHGEEGQQIVRIDLRTGDVAWDGSINDRSREFWRAVARMGAGLLAQPCPWTTTP